MQTQDTKLDFKNQDVYVGIDVGKKGWAIRILVGEHIFKPFTQPPQPAILAHYLRRNFPGARYHAVYEAGYFGFWIYQALKKEGIDCIVVSPADVPTTHKDKRRKTNPRDAWRMARGLRSGELEPIYVPSQECLEDRTLVRTRLWYVRKQTRCKNQIKAILQFYGLKPEESTIETHWSRRYIQWIEHIQMGYPSGDKALSHLIDELLYLRKKITELTKQIRELSRTDRYRERTQCLCTVPGVGLLSAMVILTELIDIHRFHTEDQLASFVGLVPDERSTGEDETIIGITRRHNAILRTILVEAAWIAIRTDPALMMAFSGYTHRMKKNLAIIRIARKLLNRVRFVLKNQQPYQIRLVKAA
jgi:transposase